MTHITDPSVEGKSEPRFYRFADLKTLNIVSNWQTLLRWIASGDFPAGIYLGANTRAWLVSEIEDWIASRPSAGAA